MVPRSRLHGGGVAAVAASDHRPSLRSLLQHAAQPEPLIKLKAFEIIARTVANVFPRDLQGNSARVRKALGNRTLFFVVCELEEIGLPILSKPQISRMYQNFAAAYQENGDLFGPARCFNEAAAAMVASDRKKASDLYAKAAAAFENIATALKKDPRKADLYAKVGATYGSMKSSNDWPLKAIVAHERAAELVMRTHPIAAARNYGRAADLAAESGEAAKACEYYKKAAALLMPYQPNKSQALMEKAGPK